MFRPYVVNEGFMLCVARLLEHTVMVDNGETGVSSSGKCRRITKVSACLVSVGV